MVLWIRLRITGFCEALAADLGGEEDLRHPAVGDASNDLVAPVLGHQQNPNLTTVCGRRSCACPVPRLFFDAGVVRSTLLSSMSNPAPSDNVVLRHAVEQIQRCLPGHWSTSVDAEDQRRRRRAPDHQDPGGRQRGAGHRRPPPARPAAGGRGGRGAQDGGGGRVRGHRPVPGAAYPRAAGGRRAGVRRPGGQHAAGAGPSDGVHLVARRGQQPVGGAADRRGRCTRPRPAGWCGRWWTGRGGGVRACASSRRWRAPTPATCRACSTSSTARS